MKLSAYIRWCNRLLFLWLIWNFTIASAIFMKILEKFKIFCKFLNFEFKNPPLKKGHQIHQNIKCYVLLFKIKLFMIGYDHWKASYEWLKNVRLFWDTLYIVELKILEGLLFRRVLLPFWKRFWKCVCSHWSIGCQL